MENEKEINRNFWDTRIFIKFHNFLRPDLQCLKLGEDNIEKENYCVFTQESVSFHITYREEKGKKTSVGKSKPQNSLKCSERMLRSKVDDLAQYFVRYVYSNNRHLGILFCFIIAFSINAFENSWASLRPYMHCVHWKESNVQTEKNSMRYIGSNKVLFK